MSENRWRTVIVYGGKPRDYSFYPAYGKGRGGVWFSMVEGREVAINLGKMLARDGFHGVIKRGRPRDLGLTRPVGIA